MLLFVCILLTSVNLWAQITAVNYITPPEKSIPLSTGVTLNYVEQGSKGNTPVMLIHGFTDSWHSFEGVLPYLPETMHVFAVSNRGHGNSSKPSGGYHARDFAADIAAFIQQKNLGSVVVVGHSLGGLIAQQFAIHYPQLSKAVVILSADAAFGDNPGLPEFNEEIGKLSDPIDYGFAEAFQKSTFAKLVDSIYLKRYVETMKVPARVWKAAMKGIIDVDLRKDIHKIDKPVLILWGDKDTICSLGDQEFIKKEIKDSRLIIYKGVGHAAHWEEPERFARDMELFIDAINQ